MEETEIQIRRKQTQDDPMSAAFRSPGVGGSRATADASAVNMQDSALLAQVGQGNENAMGTLFDRHSRAVYSVALRVLRDSEAAEDVLQDVFMQLWRNHKALSVYSEKIGPWLAIVTRSRSIAALRRQRPSESVDEIELPSSVDAASGAERNTFMERLRTTVVELSLEQRRTLETAFFDGLTHTEIAEATGDPLATVKTRIRTALLIVRKGMHA